MKPLFTSKITEYDFARDGDWRLGRNAASRAVVRCVDGDIPYAAIQGDPRIRIVADRPVGHLRCGRCRTGRRSAVEDAEGESRLDRSRSGHRMGVGWSLGVRWRERGLGRRWPRGVGRTLRSDITSQSRRNVSRCRRCRRRGLLPAAARTRSPADDQSHQPKSMYPRFHHFSMTLISRRWFHGDESLINRCWLE